MNGKEPERNPTGLVWRRSLRKQPPGCAEIYAQFVASEFYTLNIKATRRFPGPRCRTSVPVRISMQVALAGMVTVLALVGFLTPPFRFFFPLRTCCCSMSSFEVEESDAMVSKETIFFLSLATESDDVETVRTLACLCGVSLVVVVGLCGFGVSCDSSASRTSRWVPWESSMATSHRGWVSTVDDSL